MLTPVVVLLRSIGLLCRGHRAVAPKNLALRQQLAALTRRKKRRQLWPRDRLFWILLTISGLRTTLKSYVAYYTYSRTHLSLGKDSPESRPVSPPVGRVTAVPQVGGLHHRYERRAA
jgi:hypothetical protein